MVLWHSHDTGTSARAAIKLATVDEIWGFCGGRRLSGVACTYDDLPKMEKRSKKWDGDRESPRSRCDGAFGDELPGAVGALQQYPLFTGAGHVFVAFETWQLERTELH